MNSQQEGGIYVAQFAKDLSFGQGNWSIRPLRKDIRTIYGICSDTGSYLKDSPAPDSVCICPSEDGERISTVTLVIRPQGDRLVPEVVDRVEYAFSKGGWNDIDGSDDAFDEVWSLPLPTGGVVYTLRKLEFQLKLLDAIDRFGQDARLRLSVLRNYRSSFENQSYFAFFKLDGFWQAWCAMRSFMNGAVELVVNENDFQCD